MKKIIFSDIDGCIITDQKNDFSQVIKMIQRLHQLNYILILATAKTAHELIDLNQILNLPGPFIIENGGGILFKEEDDRYDFSGQNIVCFGSYRLLKLYEAKPDVDVLRLICAPDVQLFRDISNVRLAELLCLTLDQVVLAKIRYFTELIYIKDLSVSKLLSLKAALDASNIHFTQTNRFLHTYMDKHLHKGSGVKFILHNYYNDIPSQTFAIGDSLNDQTMLDICDYAFFISPRTDIVCKTHVVNWDAALEKIMSL